MHSEPVETEAPETGASKTGAPAPIPAFLADWKFALRLLDTMREPLLVLDDDLKVLIANRAFYQIFQVSPAQTEARPLFELGNGQWNIPSLRAMLLEVLHQTPVCENFEVKHAFPRIGVKTMLLNARRLNDEGGEHQLQSGSPVASGLSIASGSPVAPGSRLLLAIEDISARKEAEAALQIHIKKLEWSNRELQDFAYIASHDLQEPLRAIQAFGERLEAKCGADLSPEGRDYLHRVQEAARRMRVLIHDLLAFSRVTTKAQPFVAVDLAKVAQVAVSDLLRRMEETGGRVEIGVLPRVEADATQMRQLMQNLIDNALKFHRPDVAPHIRVEAEPPAGNDETCHWSVSDNGIGFDPKYANRIFTPFQRLHSQRKYAGTGIGLAICRKIVERHHGTLRAESAPGQGTTFHVTMPKQQPLAELPTGLTAELSAELAAELAGESE